MALFFDFGNLLGMGGQAASAASAASGTAGGLARGFQGTLFDRLKMGTNAAGGTGPMDLTQAAAGQMPTKSLLGGFAPGFDASKMSSAMEPYQMQQAPASQPAQQQGFANQGGGLLEWLRKMQGGA